MFEQLLTGRNIMLAAGVFAILATAKQVIKPLCSTHWGQRLMPLLPVLLGLIGGLFGLCDCQTWKDRVLVGIVAGFASSWMFKAGRTTVMGYGITLPEVVEKETPNASSDSAPTAPTT